MRPKSISVVSVCVLICLLPLTAAAEFRALLVGINYEASPDPNVPLRGAINDVEEMRKVMIEQLGIPDAAIKLLTETEATRANILNAFDEWLIQGTQPGDTIFFMYSGHGGQEQLSEDARHVLEDALNLTIDDPVKLPPGQQNTIELFFPYDTLIYADEQEAALPILDLEFHTLLKALQGRNVHLFFDCCFSEGATRDVSDVPLADRHADLPWDLWRYPEKFSDRLKTDLLTSLSGVLREPQPEIAQWFPEYSFFAAARFFQRSYDLKNPAHGAFTLPVLELLRNNPGVMYDNNDVLQYARAYIQQNLGIPAEYQNPVFHGPKHAENAPFVLLAQRQSPAPPVTPAPDVQPSRIDTSVTRVCVTGSPVSLLIEAIRHADFLRLDEENPDIIVEMLPQSVNFYTAFGNRFKILDREPDFVADVMTVLEGEHVKRQLAALENPAAPFSVELWIDEPGKTEFTTQDRVTLFYRVNELPQEEKAYFTLLNVAPGGGVSLLYPDEREILAGMLEQRHHSAEVEPGRIHSIPKDERLKPGQNAAVDLRLRLEQGQEYFKAIVTSEQIPWERLYSGDIERLFHGSRTRGVAGIVSDALAPGVPFFWATGDLRVNVE